MNLEQPSAWLALDFSAWMPMTQAAVLGLATLVQEDVPTVTAAVLSGAGRLSWAVAFFGCFLGIWLGDALLYWAARGLGRPLLAFTWIRRWATQDSVAQSERWFAQRGSWLLVSSRFVPGTRLPTYLAAGFLRVPFGRFLAITGGAVAVWTLIIFALAQLLGGQLNTWLQRWNQSGSWLLGLILALVAGLYLARTRLNSRRTKLAPAKPMASSPIHRQKVPGSFIAHRWLHLTGWWHRWEFWPTWLFYLPVAARYIQLAIRYRGLTVPSAANPGIYTGGLVGESKYDTLRQLWQTSPEFTAEGWLIPAEVSDAIDASILPVLPNAHHRPLDSFRSRLTELRILIDQNSIAFPLILKPDLGQRGLGVKLIRNLTQAADYLRANAGAIVVQRYLPGPLEVGIFYYRFPHETRGRIFSITEKIFPTITGDGKHTVEELIRLDERARHIADRYLARLAARRQEVLPLGETVRLVEAGNHAQGCIFRDGHRFHTPELEACIDQISQRLEGFCIGRYDLRFASEADLRAGRNFAILELNGAAAEATSIYDARNSLSTAYRQLFRQWDLVFAIGAANRQRGTLPTAPSELLRVWRATSRLCATYPAAD